MASPPPELASEPRRLSDRSRPSPCIENIDSLREQVKSRESSSSDPAAQSLTLMESSPADGMEANRDFRLRMPRQAGIVHTPLPNGYGQSMLLRSESAQSVQHARHYDSPKEMTLTQLREAAEEFALALRAAAHRDRERPGSEARGRHHRGEASDAERSLSASATPFVLSGKVPGSHDHHARVLGRTTTTPVKRDLEHRNERRKPRYRLDSLPEVEVTLKVYSIHDFRSEASQFSADIVVCLDWVDPTLKRDEHYYEEYVTQKLFLYPAAQPYVFNPRVSWDNRAEENEEMKPLPGADEYPRIEKELADGGVWMKKTQRYHGRFACNQETVHYVLFPFDYHALSLSLSTLKWKGVAPRLKNPTLRRRRAAEPTARGNQKQWTTGHVVMKSRIYVGELTYFGFGVKMFKDKKQTEFIDKHRYELLLFMRRDLVVHMFDVIMLIIMVVVSSISFCCSLNDTALEGRLSITLTVLLSLVSFTAQRPSAIATLPYKTVFDVFQQSCIVIVALMSLCHVATINVCYEVELGQECSLCLAYNEELCEQGMIAATRLDEFFLIFFGSSTSIGWMVNAMWMHWKRHAAIVDWQKLCNDYRHSRGPRRKEVSSDSLVHAEGDLALGKHGTLTPAESEGRAIAWETSSDNLPSTSPGWLRKATNRLKTFARVKDDRSTIDVDLTFEPGGGCALGADEAGSAIYASVLEFGGGEIGYYRYSFTGGTDLHVQSCGKMKIDSKQVTDAILGHTFGGSEACEKVLEELSGRVRGYLAEATKDEMGGTGMSMHKYSPPVLYMGITGRLRQELCQAARVRSKPAYGPDSLQEVLNRLNDFSRSLEGEVRFFRVRPFLISFELEATLERKAIWWLVGHANLGLLESFSESPRLKDYLQHEVNTMVATLEVGTEGVLQKGNFIEKFLELANEVYPERGVEGAGFWFDEMDEDEIGEINVLQILEFILRHEALLQAVIQHRLFIGSIACSTMSFRLTLMDPTRAAETSPIKNVLLHTSPIGNLSPSTGSGLKRPIFQPDQQVTEEQLRTWQAHIAGVLKGDDTMGQTAWPTQRRGIFVCISGMFYAAQAVGIAGRLVSKRDALVAIGNSLTAQLRPGVLPLVTSDDCWKHQQMVANLAIAWQVIETVLHEDAWLYFRREWTIEPRGIPVGTLEEMPPPCEAVATWSLGWFMRGIQGDAGREEEVMDYSVTQFENEDNESWAPLPYCYEICHRFLAICPCWKRCPCCRCCCRRAMQVRPDAPMAYS